MKNIIKLSAFGVLAFMALIVALNSYTTIQRGHVGVKTVFGKVDPTELQSGFHFVNPMAKIDEINVQNSETTFDDVDVPSQDKLLTDVDVTIKWHIDPALAAESLRDTGDKERMISTHLVPKARSVIRETGKTIAKADEFFRDEVQVQMQSSITTGLEELSQIGIVIDEVLIRGIRLPRSVAAGVIATKQREIEGQKQEAELIRYETEQQQKVALAKAEALAAEQMANQRRTLADAAAYEVTADAKARAQAIEIEGAALAKNPSLVKLRQIERWDGVMPRFIGGGDGVNMLFSMGDITK